MRFGIKTNPQHTTWPDLLAMWQRADANEAIESVWDGLRRAANRPTEKVHPAHTRGHLRTPS